MTDTNTTAGAPEPFDLNLRAVMAYAKIMLANVNANADKFLEGGITHELAKPAMPRKCPKCGMNSFCDCLWMILPPEAGGNLLMRSCPWCSETQFVAYSDDGSDPFVGYEMNVRDMHDDGEI